MAVAAAHKETATGGSEIRQRRFGWRALSICGVLGACQAAPVVNLDPTPHTLIYSYLMAHGMARGAVMSGGMNMQQLLDLIRIDREALRAVSRETAAPGSDNLRAANQAVERLIDATKPLDGGPATPAGSVKTSGSR
ncbi:hypothetical protein GOB81_02705 [Acetobacter sp. LMG 1627]|uniref:Uncharacterized protein n=2 Tax=Acetobacter conturbans TaxID=1737472 RepID=A0ABX0JVX0_9PROT|nr:hypothetical protein [Acetobacter conturbans]